MKQYADCLIGGRLFYLDRKRERPNRCVNGRDTITETKQMLREKSNFISVQLPEETLRKGCVISQIYIAEHMQSR